MKLKIFIILLFLFGNVNQSSGQGSSKYIQPRILILLDKSSSMINVWDGGRQKSKVADELVLKIMDSVHHVNPEVEFSLRVFGHQSTVDENNCRDTKNEVPFRKDNRLQMEYRLDAIQPLGVTSIAFALLEAAESDLVDVSENAYSIILITDGGESCGGDICEVMRKLSQSKVFFRPYIVNLESSATLKSAYACMGDYLEVTKKNDLPVAVGKIVAAFRPIISLTTSDYTKVKEVAATAPTVMGVTIPVVKFTDTTIVRVKGTNIARVEPARYLLKTGAPASPKPRLTSVRPYTPIITEEEPEKLPTYAISSVPLAAVKPIIFDKANMPKPKLTGIPEFVPLIRDEVIERPAPEKIARLSAASLHTVSVPPPASVRLSTRAVKPYEPVIIEEIPVRPDPVKISKLALAPTRRLMILIVTDGNGTNMVVRKVPPAPPLIFDAVKAVAPSKATAPATVAGPPLGKPADYAVETEDAEETTVEVYFTNGHGKFYATTPQIMLLDPATGKMVRRFYRTVDADGHPDPQSNIPEGTYHLTFSETRSKVVNNVKVVAHKRNKIIVTVNKASLSFEYIGATSRPVSEFSAVVIQRNTPNGKIVNQKCTERLEYEPENYHVIINTFPQDVRNIDLDFDEKVIRVAQPGFAKFVGDESMVSVTLYERLGEKFRSFHTQNLKDPVASHLRMQPGEYQAHYHKGPGGTSASEKVITFIIKPTEETEVLLK